MSVSGDWAPGTESRNPTPLRPGESTKDSWYGNIYSLLSTLSEPVDLVWSHISQLSDHRDLDLDLEFYCGKNSPSCITHRLLLTYQISSKSDEKKCEQTDGHRVRFYKVIFFRKWPKKLEMPEIHHTPDNCPCPQDPFPLVIYHTRWPDARLYVILENENIKH